jgi:hypothetical protein
MHISYDFSQNWRHRKRQLQMYSIMDCFTISPEGEKDKFLLNLTFSNALRVCVESMRCRRH